MSRFRIYKDHLYPEYVALHRLYWIIWPIWWEWRFLDFHRTVEEAEAAARTRAKPRYLLIKDLGRIRTK